MAVWGAYFSCIKRNNQPATSVAAALLVSRLGSLHDDALNAQSYALTYITLSSKWVAAASLQIQPGSSMMTGVLLPVVCISAVAEGVVICSLHSCSS